MKFEIELNTEEVRDIIRRAVKEEMRDKGLFRFIRSNTSVILTNLFDRRKNSIVKQIRKLNGRVSGLETSVKSLKEKKK